MRENNRGRERINTEFMAGATAIIFLFMSMVPSVSQAPRGAETSAVGTPLTQSGQAGSSGGRRIYTYDGGEQVITHAVDHFGQGVCAEGCRGVMSWAC